LSNSKYCSEPLFSMFFCFCFSPLFSR
jgi:hypothetical protein